MRLQLAQQNLYSTVRIVFLPPFLTYSKISYQSKEGFLSRATLTSKGQLTVPKDVRDRLGLKSGDRVVFDLEDLEDGVVRLRVERRKSLGELMGSLPATQGYPGKEAERESARRHLVRGSLEGS